MPDPVADARRAFADRNPESRRLHDEARKVLPGGHTRTILSHPPFPLTFVRSTGSVLTDADGHELVDLLGDYTAGLFGHSERRVLDAAADALSTLASVGGIHPHEAAMARLMCERFGLDRVRFTNSGTEANLLAVTTALVATGRSKVLVFDGGYHGGVLSFAGGASPANAPYDFVVGRYNDLAGAEVLVAEHADDLAAVLVEPMLGSGGCIVAEPAFLRGTFDAARAAGAVCIADEVMTSRHGRSGLAALLGAQPDVTAFGKYLGGGFSFGAFGGRAELLDLFDGRIPHAGTFNNNVASLAAGCAVLGSVFTADVAEAHTARGDDLRAQVAAVLARHPGAGVSVCGFGSTMTLHARPTAPTNATEAAERDGETQELLFLGLLERGFYVAPRGMVNLSLAVTDDQLASFLDALDEVLAELSGAPTSSPTP